VHSGRGRVRTHKIPGQRDIFYTFSFSFITKLFLILVRREDLILFFNRSSITTSLLSHISYILVYCVVKNKIPCRAAFLTMDFGKIAFWNINLVNLPPRHHTKFSGQPSAVASSIADRFL